jgi:ornithine carbamoyltransferase
MTPLQNLPATQAFRLINGLSNAHHPCQAFADVMTVQERKGRTDGIRFAFIGDGNNVAHSLIEIAARTGLDFVIAAPEGYDPDPAVVQRARSAGGRIAIVRDAREAAAGADVLYTDVWVSMGQEAEADEKVEKFRSFQINDALLGRAKPDAMVLHCLPAVRGNEITDAVMDGPHSAIFAQAENRLHTKKASLSLWFHKCSLIDWALSWAKIRHRYYPADEALSALSRHIWRKYAGCHWFRSCRIRDEAGHSESAQGAGTRVR